MILQIAYYLAETEHKGCLTYFAVHDNVKCLHIDMLIVPIVLYTGNMYGCNKPGWIKIACNLKEYLK